MFKDMPLEVPEHCQQELTGRRTRLGLFGREKGILPLHILPFGFWFMMMNPGVIPSDDAIQEVITFMVAPLQQTTADVLEVVLMPFCQMFGHPTCRNFVEHKNVMH
jgi:hypothetical protein